MNRIFVGILVVLFCLPVAGWGQAVKLGLNNASGTSRFVGATNPFPTFDVGNIGTTTTFIAGLTNIPKALASITGTLPTPCKIEIQGDTDFARYFPYTATSALVLQSCNMVASGFHNRLILNVNVATYSMSLAAPVTATISVNVSSYVNP